MLSFGGQGEALTRPDSGYTSGPDKTSSVFNLALSSAAAAMAMMYVWSFGIGIEK